MAIGWRGSEGIMNLVTKINEPHYEKVGRWEEGLSKIVRNCLISLMYDPYFDSTLSSTLNSLTINGFVQDRED